MYVTDWPWKPDGEPPRHGRNEQLVSGAASQDSTPAGPAGFLHLLRGALERGFAPRAAATSAMGRDLRVSSSPGPKHGQRQPAAQGCVPLGSEYLIPEPQHGRGWQGPLWVT